MAEAIDDWAYNSKIRLIDLREMRDNSAYVVVEEFPEEANIDLDTWLEKEVDALDEALNLNLDTSLEKEVNSLRVS